MIGSLLRRVPGARSARVAAPVAIALAGLLSSTAASAQDLQPPAPMGPQTSPTYNPPNTPTVSDESEDSGLGLEWVYLNADVGGAYTNMASLSESNLAIQNTKSSGPAFGLGAGVRLLFFTVGARVRDLALSDFNLWEIDGEAAFHIRLWRIDPYFGVRGGYAFTGSFSSDALKASDATVHGANLGPMFGIDVYLSRLVSIGAEVNAELLFLKRPPLTIPSGVTVPADQQALYNESGSSVGFGLVGTAHLGLHF